MHRKTTMTIVALALMVTASAAHAAWKVRTQQDAITDEKHSVASVTNRDGYTLEVYRAKNGAGYVMFAVARRPAQAIRPRHDLFLRVDKYEPLRIDSTDRLGRWAKKNGIDIPKGFDWNPGFVNFKVWHGKQNEGMAPILAQMMKGNKLVVRFPVNSGGTRDVIFSLSGAGRAIRTALGITSIKPVGEKKDSKQARYNNYLAHVLNTCKSMEKGLGPAGTSA